MEVVGEHMWPDEGEGQFQDFDRESGCKRKANNRPAIADVGLDTDLGDQ